MRAIYDKANTVSSGNPIKNIDELASLRRWVAWRLENGVKVPKNPRTGGNAMANNRDTWATRKEAARWWDEHRPTESLLGDVRAGGLGIMLGDLGDGRHLWGLDLDSCLDDGKLVTWAKEAVDRFPSYVETSPSGRGVKVFFLVTDADVAELKLTGGRAFSGGGDHREMKLMIKGWFAVTGAALDGAGFGPKPLRAVDADAVCWFINVAGPAYQKQMKGGGERPIDESGSGHLFRLAQLARDFGFTKKKFEDVIQYHAEAADHVAREEQRGKGRGRRAINRAWENAAKPFDPAHGKAGEPAGKLTVLSPRECSVSDTRRYVIKGLVAEGDVACIVGAPGVGKSLLAPRLAYAVSQGAGIFGLRVRQGGVLYVAAEDQHGMRGRVAALRREHGEADDFALVAGVSDLLRDDSEHLAQLKELVKARRPSLLFIDTLAIAFPGLEENTAEGMGRVVAVARSLTQWGAAVMLIHHDTKDGQQGLPRGHSLLNGALDASLHLTRDDNGIVRAKLTKNRNGSNDLDIAFTINTKTLGLDEDDDEITAAFCSELNPGSAPERKERLSPSARAAYEVFGELLGDGEAVSESAWRAACVDGRKVSASEEPDNRRRAYKRAAEELVRKRKVIFDNGSYRPSEDEKQEFK
ncbi:AAA family ATPase [Rhodomicrobium lacus]|uniref:AAA family ATPase n=1 Tax=Rhodomicrobium lacus TaxID=2498452 RepID=UPI0026E46C2C|nr:AAA family ATPase [Rhodomicrobium lacus]WKW52031.1 AAA family ATPase [Rhodomicrobium lacus]